MKTYYCIKCRTHTKHDIIIIDGETCCGECKEPMEDMELTFHCYHCNTTACPDYWWLEKRGNEYFCKRCGNEMGVPEKALLLGVK